MNCAKSLELNINIGNGLLDLVRCSVGDVGNLEVK
jgi:hypothetical protein